MSSRNAVNTFFFVNGLLFASWATRLPRLQENYSLDNKTLGLVLLAHSIGAFIAMPISGWLIVKKGSKVITKYSGFLFSAFFMSIPFAGNLMFLFISFFFMGASTGILDVAMNTQAVELEKKLKKPIMTFFHALFSIGMVAGGIGGSLFTSLKWSLHHHFVLLGILSFLALGYSTFYLVKDNAENRRKNLSFEWPKGIILSLGFIAFCCMLGEGAIADWSANYLKNIMSAKDAYIAFGLTIFALMMTLGRLWGDNGRLYFGDKTLMKLFSILACFGIILILIKIHLFVVLLGFALVGLGLSIIVPIIYSLAGNDSQMSSGIGIATVTTIGYAGFMMGPPVIGFMADAWNLRIALGFVAILFLIMTLLIYTVKIDALRKE